MIVILIIVFIGILIKLVNYSFDNIIMGQRKDKKRAFEILKQRKVYDEERYNQLEIEELKIKSKEGYRLKGYYINKFKKSNKIMIIVHGYTANHYIALQFVDMFIEEKFNVLLIDNRSHGSSEGIYPSYGYYERQDLDLWIDYIRQKFGEDVLIGLHGQSMGAATVLMYGGVCESKIKFIIADCPYSDARQLLKYQFKKKAHVPLYPLYYFVNKKIKRKCNFSMDNISPIKDIKDKEIPVLFIHGTGDTLIPYTMSEDMYKQKKGDKNMLLLIKDANHVCSYAKDKETYKNTVKTFINNLM